MPRTGETPYSPGALRAWARYMSRIGRDDLAAQLNAQADAAEQMQPVGSAFDTWLGGYGSRLGWNPQAAAPAAAKPQVSGNFLGNLGTWRPGVPLGPPSMVPTNLPGGRGMMNPVQGARDVYFGIQTQAAVNAAKLAAAQAGLGGGNYSPTFTPAPPSEWNPWASFGSGSQTGWYSANPATGYVNYEAGSIAEAQKNIAGSPEGTRLIWGSPYAAGASAAFNAGRSYLGGASPAPVIGGSRKMSWAGQTKAKKNWNPNKFAYRKMSAPNPLPMAATGPAGVGLVYGNANWGRP